MWCLKLEKLTLGALRVSANYALTPFLTQSTAENAEAAKQTRKKTRDDPINVLRRIVASATLIQKAIESIRPGGLVKLELPFQKHDFETDFSQIASVESVAVANVAGVVAAFEPTQPLFGGAVGEGVGYDIAGCLSLDLVVADCARRS